MCVTFLLSRMESGHAVVKVHPVGSIRWSSVTYPLAFYLMLEAEVVPQSLRSSLPRLRGQHVNVNIYIL